MEKPSLHFHQGTIVLKDYQNTPPLQCFLWDDRALLWRAKALYYRDILAWIKKDPSEISNRIVNYNILNLRLKMKVKLRDYQNEGLQAWQDAGGRGSVCLPTGAGKSWVALLAMQHIAQSCLVVLPTIDLMNQWYALITDAFGIEVGILGGGYHEIRDVTVTTYDSAYRHADKYGNRFGLLVFDEIHHLPALTYSHIPEMCIAPYRLGLTATYQRLDGLHGKLEYLVGPMVYERNIRDLEGKYLAKYEVMKIAVDLTPDEKKTYDRNFNLYENYIRDKGIKFYGNDLQEFLQASAYDPKARKAFIARLQSRRIMIAAERKLEVLETLLKRCHSDRVLIFTESNDLVYKISEMFLIPALTQHTKIIERKSILDNFRRGIYSVLVTSKVLNEGVDVPNANVAIILGGSASPVEHVQRLGRILRKAGDKQAILYELVTRGTQESQISYRRRRADAYK